MNQTIKINPLKYPNIKCDKCSCETFVQAVILKKIPGLEVGTGTEDQVLDLPVYICSKCGEILARDKEAYGLIETTSNVEEVSETKPNILTEEAESDKPHITKLILD